MKYSCCNRAVAVAVTCALATGAMTPNSVYAQAATQTTAGTDEIPQVVVTGSFIKRPADRPQPLTVLSDADLNDAQRNSVAETLKDLPQNVGSMAVVNTQGGGINAGNTPTTTVNLRGLGPGATLPLLNGGRQIADGGFGYVDINNLAPSIMIARVEVLTDGSSALYGADAVAGVVNLITKKNFSGFDVKADFQRIETTTHSRPDTNIGLLWGGQSENTSVVLGLEYQTTEMLLADERYSPDRVKFGLSSGFGSPGTVQTRVSSGTARFVPDPLCGSSSLGGGPSGLAAGVLSTTGTPSCLQYSALGRGLQPQSQRINGLGTVTHKFTDTITGDFEVGFARTRYDIPFGYMTPAVQPAGPFPLIPVDNPGAIAEAKMFPSFPHPLNGQTNITGYSFRGRVLDPWSDNGKNLLIQQSSQDTYRASGRLNGVFGKTGWDWQLGYSDSWNDTIFIGHDTFVARVTLALNGYGGPRCTYNPTTDPTGAHRGVDTCKFWSPFAVWALTQPGNPAYNDPVISNWLIGERGTHDKGSLQTYDAVTTGKLWDMPGGTTGVAIGVQRRELSFKQTWDDSSKQIGIWGFNGAFAQTDFSGSAATDAAFAEMAVYPLKAWEVQLAGRYEKTSYAGAGSFSKFTPKLGVLWTPVKGLFIRGSAGSSFQAPGPANLFSQASGGASTQVIGGDGVNARGLLIGNPNLGPQTSKNWNVGVTWDVTSNFTAEINYWNVKFKDLIRAESADAILTADLADGFITDPRITLGAGLPNEVCERTGRWKPGSGPRPADCMSGFYIQQFTTTYANQGFLNTNGIDYDFRYRLDEAPFNLRYSLRLYGTYTHEYEMLQDRVLYDGVGKYNNSTFGVPIPKYTVNLAAGVRGGAHSLQATVRYMPALELLIPTTANVGTESKSFTTLDLLYRYELPWSKGSSVSAAIMNVTGEDDPIAAGALTTSFGNTYNFLGRIYRVGVDYKF